MIAWTRGRIAVLGTALALAAPLCSLPAEASRYSRYAGYQSYSRATARVIYAGVSHYSHYRAAYRGGYALGGLQCVPFARENTGIELSGNAVNWWDNAAGVYERGARPEVGSILNFRATGRMHLGHVAVVSNVVNDRSVQIDHANWSGRGVVTRNVTVVDVSPSNDWSAVRVALGTGDFGSVYPTYGFIYDRPDKGTMLANAATGRTYAPAAQSAPITVAAAPVLNPAPLDLRPQGDRMAVLLAPQQDEEVAEATDDAGTYRTRRSARAMPVVRYGRGDTRMARYGGMEMPALRHHGRGHMEMARFGRGMDRMFAGRMMGGQVLFIGHGPVRGLREPAFAPAGRGYTGMVRLTGARALQAEHGQARAAAVRPVHGHADTGSHRRGRRA